jgi:hypothetical protein
MALAFTAGQFGIQSKQYLRFARDGGLFPSPKPFDIATEQRRVAALQGVIPRGERMLVNVFASFPLDLKRNPIFVADFVGMAGLPPGMPVGQGPGALRAYFLEHSIRYIAFDFKRIGIHGVGRTRLPDRYPSASLKDVLANPSGFGRHSWSTVQAKVYNDEQQNFRALAKAYQHLYSDPETCALDLELSRSRL